MTAYETPTVRHQKAVAAANALAPMVARVAAATGMDLREAAIHDPVLAVLGCDYVGLLATVEEAAERTAELSYGQADPVGELRFQALCRQANLALSRVATTITARLLALSVDLLTASPGSGRRPLGGGPGSRSDAS